jgi:TonB family protein
MSSLSEVSKTWIDRDVDGKFTLRQWISGSDRGAIFLTERRTPEVQKAAIKLIPTAALPGSADAQLSRWAESAELSHPHLMRVFERGHCQIDDVPFVYVVEEYAEENLSQILPERALSPEEAKQMIAPVVEALAFLHQSGFVHSRLQPSNVMAVNDQLKVSTDSLGKTGEAGERHGGAYNAPEVATVLSPAADVWSLGVLLVAALTQHEPDVNHRNDGQVGVPDAVPQPFRGIAQQCLRADPRRRCTVQQILSQLKGEAPPAPGVASAPDQSPPAVRFRVPNPAPVAATRVAKPRRKLGTIVLAVIALLIVAVLLGRKLMVHGAQGNASATPGPEPQSPAQSQPEAAKPSSENSAALSRDSAQGSVAQKITPEVSPSAQRTIHGRIKISVQVSVDAAGNVTQAKVVKHVASQYFARQALSAARLWKFNPPQPNGHPSPSEWDLSFQFAREGMQASSSQRKP